MSIDDLRAIDPGSPIETDVCLIGSGPAGWAIAEELRDSGLRIVMVESGGRTVDPVTEALNESEDIGRKLFNGRARVLGGTSRLWNGRCIPFDDIDYERRPWVPSSGWPFGPEAMAADVDRAAAHFGVGPYYDGIVRRPMPAGLRPRPPVDPALLTSVWWENRACVDFGRAIAQQRGANLWVLVRATVTQLVTDPNGRRIVSVEVADANGRRLTIHPRAVVLCAGGIENPRILLASNRRNPAGLGNAHDTVGRCLMDHPRDFQLIARVENGDAGRLRRLFGPWRLDHPRGPHDFSYGFALSPRRQRAEGLLNAAAWPYEVVAEDDPLSAAKRLVRGPRAHAVRDIGRVLSQPGLLARAAQTALFTHQRPRQKVSRIGFLIASEQLPDPARRVQLGTRRDWLGVPISRVDWRVGELEARSQAVLAESIAEEFARLGLPRIHLADWVRQRDYLRGDFADGCHPSGTTRMAEDPRHGVVDADCRVHGVHGLFVAGSSVFPTGGHANPTLMIVALAVRLARHLRGVLGQQSAQAVLQPQSALAAD